MDYLLRFDSTVPNILQNTLGFVVIALILILATHTQAASVEGGIKTVEYHGIRPTDPGGRVGLRNPERGFRTETVIAELPTASGWISSGYLAGKTFPRYAEDWWTADAAHFEPFGLTLAQVYVYLEEFTEKPISRAKLSAIQKSFDTIRKRGIKAVLRFAYMRDIGNNNASWELIDRHLDQLAPIIRKNSDVIYVMQAGFVGAWGEWHTHLTTDPRVKKGCADVVLKVLKILPENISTQVRVPKYKTWALTVGSEGKLSVLNAANAHTNTPAARIGFNNDGYLAGPTDGGTWTEEPFLGSPGNPEFDIMTRESAYVPVDGELFWSDQAGMVDGFKAIERFRLHHYSSFSIAHSYSDREIKNYSIDHWMVIPITLKQVKEAKLPVSDSYFQDNFGNEVPRTQFEYIQDHLGYRIELQKATYPESVKIGCDFKVDLELINRGFSTIHNPRPVEFILIDRDEKVVELGKSGSDPRKWQPYTPEDPQYAPLLHKIAFRSTIDKTIKPGWYKLALWMPDAAGRIRLNPNYSIRVANRDVPWLTNSDGKYGANVLGVLEIKE